MADRPLLMASPSGIHRIRAHVGRRRFLYLSLVLHLLPLGTLGYLHHAADVRTESARRERLVETGMQLTVQARLEKRVQDMAQIKALLEQSTAGKPAPAPEPAAQPATGRRPPAALLKDARNLSRAIDTIERDIKADQLARELKIPKEKALERLAQQPKPEEAVPEPTTRDEAAARIAQLEARARKALEQRRQQLERQPQDAPVPAAPSSASRPATPLRPGPAGANGKGKQDTSIAQREQSGASRNGRAGAGGTGNGEGAGGAGLGDGTGNSGASRTTILNQIAAFANPDLPDRRTVEYTGLLADYYDHGIGRIPALDTKPMLKGAGRIIGAGGSYANRVYVNSWYLIGPFQGKHGGGLFSNGRFAPEDAVALDAVYRGKANRLLQWKYVNMATYPLIPADAAENAVYYGYTELMLDEEQDLVIWVGADDDAQLWINDKLAWKGGNVNKDWFFSEIYNTANTYVRDYNLTEDKRVAHFRKGRNRLLFKLSNGPTRLFFSLVLTKAP